MTLDEFTRKAYADYIANQIIKANPRLKRGDDMNQPVGLFQNGKLLSNAEATNYCLDNPASDALEKFAVAAQSFKVSIDDIEKLNLPMISSISAQYLHMYVVYGYTLAPGEITGWPISELANQFFTVRIGFSGGPKEGV